MILVTHIWCRYLTVTSFILVEGIYNMKIMKCLLALTVVSCFGISLFLTSFTVGFAATITPNPVSQGTKLITIKAGDTLWFLAGVYLKDPMLWGQFKQYNHFTDPNLIFPGERLLVPTTFQMPADSVPNMVDVLQKPVVSEEVIVEIQTKLEEAGISLASINKMVSAFDRVGVPIQQAVITTIGHQVIDTFFLIISIVEFLCVTRVSVW